MAVARATTALWMPPAAAVRQWLTEQGKPDSFDIVMDGQTPAGDPAAAAVARARMKVC